MPMCIDQPRHHEASAAIDEPRAFRWGYVTGGDALDTITLDKQAKSFAQSFGPAVEKLKIPKHDWRGRVRRSGLRPVRPNKAERRERATNPGNKAASRHFPVDPTSCRLKARRTTKAGRTISEIGLVGGSARNHQSLRLA